MGVAIHRTSFELRESISTPAYRGDADWKLLVDAKNGVYVDYAFLRGLPPKYIKWNGTTDLPEEKSTAEKAAADVAEAEARKDAEVDDLASATVDQLLVAFALVVRDELNGHAAHINAILDAVDGASNLAGLKSAVAAIADYPTRTVDQLKAAVRAKLT